MSNLFFKAQFGWFCRNSESPIAKRPRALTIFMWVCGLSNCCDGTKPFVAGSDEVVKSGQVLTGRADLAKLTGLTEQTVRTELKWLETHGFINQQTNQQGNQRGTLITVCNWEEICGLGQAANQQTNQQTNHVLESSISPKGEIDIPPAPRKAKRPSPVAQANPEDLEMAQQWAEYALSVRPHMEPKIPAYAEALRKLREKYGTEKLRYALEFVKRDKFWRDKATSPMTLTAIGKNGETKFSNILSSMPGAAFRARRELKLINDVDILGLEKAQ